MNFILTYIFMDFSVIISTTITSITCLEPRILFKVDALRVLTKLEPLGLMLKVGAS